MKREKNNMNIYNNLIQKKGNIAIIGLGYVGMPLLVEFSKKLNVIGYDCDCEKVDNLKKTLNNNNLKITCDASSLSEASVLIVAVPTPIKKDNTPDFSFLEQACKVIGENLRKQSIIIFESTVYPGITEGLCTSILENISGYKCGIDFKIAYSPERINPGDDEHSVKNVVKVVSAMDEDTLNIVKQLYELIVEAGVYCAENIKIAEAAKVIENIQRDVNIALMNEASMILDGLDINMKSVIKAMNTKWNHLNFTPGLVGGHCIGVDPYYFSYLAYVNDKKANLVNTARNVNDSVSIYIATKIKEYIKKHGAELSSPTKIVVLGFAFKENCDDIRNTKVYDLVESLREDNFEIVVVDDVVSKEKVLRDYGIKINMLNDVYDADIIVIAVPHNEYRVLAINDLVKMYNIRSQRKLLVDVKGVLEKEKIELNEIDYWSL